MKINDIMKHKTSKIAVVIPNYNDLKYLKNCLKSIEKAKFDDLNVIIVDNGSDEETIRYLNDKVSKNPNHETKQLKRLKYHLISNKKNLGFSKAVNQGIEYSNILNIEYICLLNNDLEIDENYFIKILEAIENDDTIFSVSSKMIRYYERDIIDDAGDEYTILGWTHKNGDGKEINKFNKIYEVFSSCGGAAIYRKDILDKIGYFDEDYFIYLEDIDLGYRSQIYGYKNVFCPCAKVYHIVSGASGGKYNEFKAEIAARNNIYLIHKNMPWPQIVLNIGFLTVGFFIKYLFFIKKGYGNLYLNGLKKGIIKSKKIKKIKFNKSNLLNYFKIEYKLIINCFKLLK
ncbi:MAG: glycosyltransferase family 2 protein [Methanobrevibacter sp.]|nr:glycosyltransferase family 2 protein [Methanobrevibacter sp.]